MALAGGRAPKRKPINPLLRCADSNDLLRGLIALAATGLVLAPAVAVADSDGYYCIGKCYLAYEMRFSAPVDGHTLTILTPSPDGSVVAQRTDFPIPEFQTHAMVCLDGAVRLRDLSHLYNVDIGDGSIDRMTLRVGAPADTPAANLVYGARIAGPNTTQARIVALPG